MIDREYVERLQIQITLFSKSIIKLQYFIHVIRKYLLATCIGENIQSDLNI